MATGLLKNGRGPQKKTKKMYKKKGRGGAYTEWDKVEKTKEIVTTLSGLPILLARIREIDKQGVPEKLQSTAMCDSGWVKSGVLRMRIILGSGTVTGGQPNSEGAAPG